MEVFSSMTNKKMGNEIIELSVLDARMKQLDEQLRVMEQQMYDNQMTESALEDISGKKNSEIMLPLGGGIFIPGKVESTDKVVIHLGNKVFAKKKLEDAKKFLQKQKDRMTREGERIGKEMQMIFEKMAALENAIRTEQARAMVKSKPHKCDDEDCECGHSH